MSRKFYFLFITFLWCLIVIPYFQAVSLYFNQNAHFTNLAHAKNGNLNRGSIFAEYEISYTDNNKLYFNNTNNANSLVIQDVAKLPPEDLKKFKAYLLIEKFENNSFNKQIIIDGYFNNCPISKSQFRLNILNKKDGNYYTGFNIPTSCVNSENNYILTKSSNAGGIKGIKLYIANEKVDYLFLDSAKIKIYFMAAIGLIYVIFFIILSYLMVKKINNKIKEK